MRKNECSVLPRGKEVVQKYVAHSNTPHGRLRHDLLFMYYDKFIKDRDVDWIIDIGGGSGLLVERLLGKYPGLKAVIIDADEEMINKAKEYLAPYLDTQRIEAVVGEVGDFPAVFKSLPLREKSILTTFNHTIEYVENKKDSLYLIQATIPKGSFFGIMYLNNSHEAMRKLIFKDSPEGVLSQLDTHQLDMIYFGLAEAVGTEELENYFFDNGCTQLEEYGLRCISDFKPYEYVEKNYEQILKMEFVLGKMSDFIGLARYRLKIFGL